MLPLSLRQLSDSFKVANQKGVFSLFINDLNYNGVFPKFEFFSSLSLTEYLNLQNQYSK